MSNEVTEYIEALNEPWQKELAMGLRDIVHEAITDVQERVQYKKPHFLKNGKYAAVISVSKDAVSFTIFHTAAMELPSDLFSGPAERKTLKLRNGDSLHVEQLVSWVQEASSTI